MECDHFLPCLLLSHTFLSVVGYIPHLCGLSALWGETVGLYMVLKTWTGISEVWEWPTVLHCWQPLHFSRAGRMDAYLPAFVTISRRKACSWAWGSKQKWQWKVWVKLLWEVGPAVVIAADNKQVLKWKQGFFLCSSSPAFKQESLYLFFCLHFFHLCHSLITGRHRKPAQFRWEQLWTHGKMDGTSLAGSLPCKTCLSVATHRATPHPIPLQQVHPPGYKSPVAQGSEALIQGLDRWWYHLVAPSEICCSPGSASCFWERKVSSGSCGVNLPLPTLGWFMTHWACVKFLRR